MVYPKRRKATASRAEDQNVNVNVNAVRHWAGVSSRNASLWSSPTTVDEFEIRAEWDGGGGVALRRWHSIFVMA
jgi:hypothetical protein